ncbi:MAG: hypothetical protein AB1414_08300 [bacterium]
MTNVDLFIIILKKRGKDGNIRNRSGCNEGEMEKLGKKGKSILILVRKSSALECH